MRVNGEEVHLCNYNPVMLGIMRGHTIESAHCYCVNCVCKCTNAVQWNDVPLYCTHVCANS